MASGVQEREWQKIVAEAWADPEFKQRLLSDPRAVLAERGILLDDDIEVKVVESETPVRYLWLPPKPDGEDEVEVLERYSSRLTTRAMLTTRQTALG